LCDFGDGFVEKVDNGCHTTRILSSNKNVCLNADAESSTVK
jgi:hypothetical protein